MVSLVSLFFFLFFTFHESDWSLVCIVVWKRQFIYVYGRLYEVNGRRSSIRIQRYSMDALACTSRFLRLCFFFFQLMDETPLIRYPWNMQWLNSFSLHSSFWVSLSESAKKGLRCKRWGADESLYRQGKGACHCDWSPLCIDFDQQNHVITLFHVFLGMIWLTLLRRITRALKKRFDK